MEKKLYRSVTDKKLGGVLGGLGVYLNVDPTLLRVVYVVASFFLACFPGLILYIILWAVIPETPAAGEPYVTTPPAPPAWNGQPYPPQNPNYPQNPNEPK